MSESVKKDFEIEDLLTVVDRDGVACATVKDGWVLIFTKSQLQSLMDQITVQGKDKGMIFIKNREFKN